MKTTLGILILFCLTIVLRADKSLPQDEPPHPHKKGTLRGQCRIGPLCPVQPCQIDEGVLEEIYASYRIVIARTDAEHTFVKALRLHREGDYRAHLRADNYYVTIDPNPCQPCEPVTDPCPGRASSCNVPAAVVISPGQETIFDIQIDTGIR